jgi:prepilin-type processing-associated H-X9-DG protein
MPLLWRKRALAVTAGGAALLAAAIVSNGVFWKTYSTIPAGLKLSVTIQIVFWVAGGAALLALVIHEFQKRRDAQSGLLAMWILGTFVFSAFFNWTVNARTLLPMAPAIGILLVRRYESRFLSPEKIFPRATGFILAAGALLALLVTQSDFAIAAADRLGALELHERYGTGNNVLWFDGHWGYQFYMEKFGATAVDIAHPQLKAGDILALPLNNSTLRPPDPEYSTMVDAIAVPVDGWLTTINRVCGGGFYAATHGPLPFAFGCVPPQYVCVFSIRPPKSKPPISH